MFITIQKENGKYYPKTCNGVQYVLPSEAYVIAKDLLDYCDTYTDEAVKRINKEELDKIFLSNDFRG